MSTETIQQRISGREAAATLIEMAAEDVKGEPDAFREAFWREIAKESRRQPSGSASEATAAHNER